MGYDLQPLVTVDEKKKILKTAIEENWKMFFEHDPETAFTDLMSKDKGIVLKINLNHYDGRFSKGMQFLS